MRSGFDVIRGTPSRRLRYCSSPSRRSLMKSSAKNLSAAALCAECGAVVAFRCGGVSHPAWYANSADAQTNETRFQAALHHARRTQRMRCAPRARSGTRSGALAALLLAAGAAGTPLRVHALERRVGRSRATPKPPNETGRAHARIPAGREEGVGGPLTGAPKEPTTRWKPRSGSAGRLESRCEPLYLDGWQQTRHPN